MDIETSIRKAAGGDLEAFTAITRAFQHMAFGYALGLVRDFRDAEDVVQEAFVAAPLATADAVPAETVPADDRLEQSHLHVHVHAERPGGDACRDAREGRI
jgi:hypothetical protein